MVNKTIKIKCHFLGGYETFNEIVWQYDYGCLIVTMKSTEYSKESITCVHHLIAYDIACRCQYYTHILGLLSFYPNYYSSHCNSSEDQVALLFF